MTRRDRRRCCGSQVVKTGVGDEAVSVDLIGEAVTVRIGKLPRIPCRLPGGDVAPFVGGSNYFPG